jgi:myo-inositol-1(or 4)-monophosphatase
VPEITGLLSLAKLAASRAADRILRAPLDEQRDYTYDLEHKREIKSPVDRAAEAEILATLAPAGVAILSEESGLLPPKGDSTHTFIVDPLDGTFNFVKGLGPSAVSIALWKKSAPVFGVLFELGERRLYWGGRNVGAYVDDRKLCVSGVSQRSEASICTGFPVRFDVADETASRRFQSLVAPYAKVRMLGSAAVSLLHVARGSADAYSEERIMLWDVAAGIAIVEGAGGVTTMSESGPRWCYDVFASNPSLAHR